ncbi:MAG TPA: Bug family tripartite tricarboxylate transporter substrate binding protein [Burkholderiales bacterium]
MGSISRRRFVGAAASAALGSLVSPRLLQAQTLMDTVRIVTGFPPGGTSDTICRRVAERLRGNYAKATFVENRTGAAGQIAIEAMKNAPADGSTILQTPASMLMIYPYIYKKLPYDPFVDVVPVSLGATFVFGFAIGPAVPDSVRSVGDFLAWCKANPKLANFGTPAAGSVPHFLGALLEKASGVELRHVGYRGTQPAIIDLIGGQISAVCGPVGEFTQHVRAGKIRLLATSGTERTRFAPDTATFVEQGFPSVASDEWFGFFMPGKSQPAAVQRANAALRAALAAPDVIEGLAVMGLESKSSTPEELARLLRADHDRWGPIVKSIGFSADS